MLELRQLTAAGRGAVSVFELRGPGAAERVAALVSGPLPEPGSLRPARLVAPEGELVDEALVVVHDEAQVELHLHGAPPVVARVRRELERAGELRIEPPPRGLEARALELLAEASGEAAARLLLAQAEGALRRELEALLREPEDRAPALLSALLERGALARRVLTPPVVVLAGPVNAGKSTLFNVLVGEERVVVDPEEGTTRDAVRERARLGALAIELVDTAGERDAGGTAAGVERAGQELGRALRERADLVLWLRPPGTEAPAHRPRLVVLASRSDEGPGDLSARTDPVGARVLVEAVLRDALELDPLLASLERGTPFDEPTMAALERALEAARSGEDWREAVESLLQGHRGS